MTTTDEKPTEVRERFRMNDDRYALDLCMRRSSFRSPYDPRPTLTCYLYASLGPTSEDPKAPKIRASISMFNDDHGSENIRLVKVHTGLTLNFGHNEINNIHLDERDRLHAFLMQVRGVEYHYTADLFGFLLKDGSDVPQKHDLRFDEPAINNSST